MVNLKKIKKTGKKVQRLLAGLAATIALTQIPQALADGSHLSAEVDHTQIGLDESVSLKLSVTLEGSQSAGQPQYKAPDFEEVNSYTQSFTESYYDNGKFGMRHTESVVKVLRPTHKGRLKISEIQVQVAGQTLRADDLEVQVTEAGAGTPPVGNSGANLGLRASGKHRGMSSIMVRAEVDKDHAYKGEQVIVSYYLYRNTRMFNVAVDAFPELKGFLREELETPILGQSLQDEKVVLNGQLYQRSLLARYAAYPLQEGKLTIDPLGLKYNYISNLQSNQNGDEDPFQMFFNQMAPQSGKSASEPVAINVIPLPEEGKPPSFSGGVGDFSITSAVDKYEVAANDAVTLKVKVEGRGNIAAIGEPQAHWPTDVELYDTKGTAKIGKQGVGEKDFEYLLIPRSAGKITLPSLEFSFFDPSKKTYVTRKTEPVEITVSPGVGGAPVSGNLSTTSNPVSPPSKGDTLAGLKPLSLSDPGSQSHSVWTSLPNWRWMYLIFALAFFALVGFVSWDQLKQRRTQTALEIQARTRAALKSFAHLRSQAAQASRGLPWSLVLKSYESLSQALFEAIDRRFNLGAKALSRTQLEAVLVGENGIPPALWQRISKLLEYAETVQFAGVTSEASARKDLVEWVYEGERLTQELGRHISPTPKTQSAPEFEE